MGRCSYVIKVEEYGALMKRAWSVVDQEPIFIFSGCSASVLNIEGSVDAGRLVHLSG
jgi:hypothetical protein